MVKYLLALLLLVSCFVSAKAQNDDWFKGSWYGAKSFSRARIGIKVLVRIEVDSLYNNHFSGRLIYMYPKDTIARLIRTFAVAQPMPVEAPVMTTDRIVVPSMSQDHVGDREPSAMLPAY